jgi:hypothetical protein
MTIEQIKQDENFLCGLELPAYNFSVYVVYIGMDRLQYYGFKDGIVLFEGTDYRPAPSWGSDTLEAAIGCVSWLTLGYGTPREYFEHYTPEQLVFSESPDAEALQLLCGDYFNPEETEEGRDFYKQAKEIFAGGFID